MDKKVVIIPTYNEKENIENIIRAVFSLEGEYHILVIEDGSPDGTAAIVKKMQKLLVLQEMEKQKFSTIKVLLQELWHILLVNLECQQYLQVC